MFPLRQSCLGRDNEAAFVSFPPVLSQRGPTPGLKRGRGMQQGSVLGPFIVFRVLFFSPFYVMSVSPMRGFGKTKGRECESFQEACLSTLWNGMEFRF